MKLIRDIITNICCTFTVLSVLFGILCEAGVFENLPYTAVIFTLLIMSAGTSVFVTARELLLPNVGGAKYVIEFFGCTVIILLSLHFAGWLKFQFSYFLLIFAMVLVVYLMVWLLTWLQSKHDEGNLNALLKRREDKRSNAERK